MLCKGVLGRQEEAKPPKVEKRKERALLEKRAQKKRMLKKRQSRKMKEQVRDLRQLLGQKIAKLTN